MVFEMPFYWAFGKILPCRWKDEWTCYPDGQDEDFGVGDYYDEKEKERRRGEESDDGWVDRGSIMRQRYHGVGFVVPGVILENTRSKKMFIVKDIIHGDFEPSIFPKKNSTLVQWHRNLVNIIKKWESLSDTKQRLEIKPVNHVVLEEMLCYFIFVF